jgi:2-succinyl-5-enolpyruvyl-6-hydroxy-3-cyclohexene-1-carboxylate synthase
VVDGNDSTATVAATFAATLVDEWARAGLRHAVIAPGSRSTPLAVALASDTRLQVHVHHDERAGGFTALGIAASSGLPSIVLTTSGTAAAELHAAVVEADLGRVPLVVCTADRPPELRGVGAPQTIDQNRLYGTATRWFCEPGVPDDALAAGWRSIGARAVCEALGPPPGPVHLNLAFRDPLTGTPDELPAGRSGGAPWHQRIVAPRRIAHEDAMRIATACRGRNGIIVAGTGIRHPEHVLLLAHTLRWPVFADPRSGCRVPDRAVVSHFDALARSQTADAPDVVIRLGMPPSSKALGQWLARLDVVEILVDRDGWWFDPERDASMIVEADPSIACLELAPLLEDETNSSEWLDWWTSADEVAEEAIAAALGPRSGLNEPAIARAVMAAVPDDGDLVVASSMPIRDLEWYSAPRESCRVIANRGANGIDGVVSTAVGVALDGRPTTGLVGDVAFLHDLNGLLGARDRSLALTIVVVDNDGGGIFSFLPQSTSMPSDRFEALFGTPHGLAVDELAAAYGARTHVAVDEPELAALVAKCAGDDGVDVVVARTDRHDNVAVHDSLNEAIATALRDR